MAIWLIRAGRRGFYEQKFLQEGRIYITMAGLSVNLDILPDRDAFFKAMSRIYPNAAPHRLSTQVQQIWPFAHEMAKGDLVLLLLDGQPAVAVGEIMGDYRFDHTAADPFYHWRPVRWIADAVARSHFGSDLQLSFGTRMSICGMKRNNAAQRIAAMQANDWKPEPAATPDENSDETIQGIDLEAVAEDRIARLIAERFKNDDLTVLVEAVLKAQGYMTCLAGSGADAVILAGSGQLGFGAPRLCVQVSMSDIALDRPAVDGLLSTAEKFGAQEALLVSWSGFVPAMQQELSRIFFRLRLWTKKELLEEIFSSYSKLDDDIKGRLQLKPVWVSTAPEP